MEPPRPTREELRARLREKRHAARGGGASGRVARDAHAAAEAAVLRVAGDDPQMLRLAHGVLRDPDALLRAARGAPAAPPPPAAVAEEEEEEGLPPSGA